MTVNLNALEVHLLNSSADSVPVMAGVRASAQIADLTRRMTAGDEAAFREFYDAYSGRLWRYLLVMTGGNEDSAREALQATLIRVARHVKMFHDETVFWSWLTVLARSAYRDDSRKHRRYFSFLDRFTRHTDLVECKSDNQDADEQLNAALERHIAALTPDEQKLIEQKYFARRSVRDLAGEWQTTEKAIESKLSRIRHKLKSAVLAGLNHEP